MGTEAVGMEAEWPEAIMGAIPLHHEAVATGFAKCLNSPLAFRRYRF